MKQLELAAGVQFDVITREDIATTGHEIARKYWGGAKYKLAKNMAVSGRLEDNVNVRYESNFSSRVVFDYDF